jgi:hypothetical protein
MKKGETVKGKNLAKTMRERDLVRKANKVHIVPEGTERNIFCSSNS